MEVHGASPRTTRNGSNTQTEMTMNKEDKIESTVLWAALALIILGCFLAYGADDPPTQTETKTESVTTTWSIESVEWSLNTANTDYAIGLTLRERPVKSDGTKAHPRVTRFMLEDVQKLPDVNPADGKTNTVKSILLARFKQAEATGNALANVQKLRALPANAWMLTPTNPAPVEPTPPTP